MAAATLLTSLTIAPLAHAADYTTEINFVTAIGVEGFATSTATSAMTRGGFAKALAQALDYTADTVNATQYFTDVPAEHEAYAYVSYLVAENIIHGYDLETFMPDKTISYVEAMKLCLNALGYDIYADIIGGYTDGYLNLADKIGMDVDVIDENALNQGEAAEIIYKMLNSYYVEVGRATADGVEFEESSETLAEKIYDIEQGQGQVTAVKNGYIYGVGVDGTDEIMIDFVPYKTTQQGLIDLIGVTVDYYAIDGDIVYMEKNEDVKTYNIMFDEIKSSSTIDEISAKLDGKTEEFEIDGNAYWVYNGAPLSNPQDSDLDITYGEINLVDNDDDEVIDVVIIWEYQTYVVSAATNTRVVFKENNNTTIAADDKKSFISLDDEDKTVNLMYGTKFMDPKLLDVGYVISYAESKDGKLITMYAYAGEIEGTLTGYDASGLTTIIDDSEYPLIPGVDLSKLMGVTTTFYMDKFNRVVDYIRFDESQVGLLLSMAYDESEETLYTKVLTQAGVQRYVNKMDTKIKVGVGDTTNATKKTVDSVYTQFLSGGTSVAKQLIKLTLTSTGESLASIVLGEDSRVTVPGGKVPKLPTNDEEEAKLRLSYDHDIDETNSANESTVYRQYLTLKGNTDGIYGFEIGEYDHAMMITIAAKEEDCQFIPASEYFKSDDIPLYDFQLYNINRLGLPEYIVANMDVEQSADYIKNGMNQQAMIVTEVNEAWDEVNEKVDYSITGIMVSTSFSNGTVTTVRKDTDEPLMNAPIKTSSAASVVRPSRYTFAKDTYGNFVTDANGDYIPSADGEGIYEWADIREGDIILYSTNSMTGNVMVWSYLSRREDLGTDYSNNDWRNNFSFRTIDAEVKYLSENAMTVITDDIHWTDPDYQGILSESDPDLSGGYRMNENTIIHGNGQPYGGWRRATVIYDTDTHEATLGDYSDICVGDRVFVYSQGLYAHVGNLYVVIR